MAPTEFSLRLQKGITGGFAPSTPSEIHTITKAKDQSSIFIASSYRPNGTAILQDSAPKTLPFDDSHDDTKLVEELYSILSSIPQPPPGSADVYGLDTSIAWGSDALLWQNSAPEGCGGNIPDNAPTQEDKAKFARAVEIIKHLVSEGK